jgi:8-oxo-dGTP pyrophosphatase MutT (NUDIX family)
MPLVRPRQGESTILAELYKRRLIKDEWYYPDGKGGERMEIFSRWDAKCEPPAIVFPFTADRRVIALRQFRNGADDFVIELPGGPTEHGESVSAGIIRELREETGYEAGNVLATSKKTWIDPASLRIPFIPAVALGCVKVGEPRPEKTEILEVLP